MIDAAFFAGIQPQHWAPRTEVRQRTFEGTEKLTCTSIEQCDEQVGCPSVPAGELFEGLKQEHPEVRQQIRCGPLILNPLDTDALADDEHDRFRVDLEESAGQLHEHLKFDA